MAFLDADDVRSPGHLEHELGLLAAHPEVDAVCGRANLWYSWRYPDRTRRPFHAAGLAAWHGRGAAEDAGGRGAARHLHHAGLQPAGSDVDPARGRRVGRPVHWHVGGPVGMGQCVLTDAEEGGAHVGGGEQVEHPVGGFRLRPVVEGQRDARQLGQASGPRPAPPSSGGSGCRPGCGASTRGTGTPTRATTIASAAGATGIGDVVLPPDSVEQPCDAVVLARRETLTALPEVIERVRARGSTSVR